MKTPIDQAVDRFLCWKLPEGFSPDNGITFKRESDYEHPEFGRTKYEPTGTNLLTAEQTKAMLEHVCEPLQTALQERDAEIARWTAAWDQLNETTGTKLAAQRKVLEQAHKALNVAVIQNGCYMIMTGEELRKCESAITAIQGVLK